MSLAASLADGGEPGDPPPARAVPARGPPGRGGGGARRSGAGSAVPSFLLTPLERSCGRGGGPGVGGAEAATPSSGRGVRGADGGPPLAAAEATREQSQLPTPSPAHPSPGKWALFVASKRSFLKAKFASRGPRVGWLGVLMGLAGSSTPFPGVPRSSPGPWGENKSPPR